MTLRALRRPWLLGSSAERLQPPERDRDEPSSCDGEGGEGNRDHEVTYDPDPKYHNTIAPMPISIELRPVTRLTPPSRP
jgi:hypothetical protein